MEAKLITYKCLFVCMSQAFNITLEVYNFPLKEQSEQEKTLLEVVKSQRRIEIAELAVCCHSFIYLVYFD